MFRVFGETFDLMKVSYNVLSRDHELLIFPAAALGSVLTVLAFTVLVGSGTGALTGAADVPYSIDSFMLGAGFLLGSTVITIFFNAALVAGALERLRGGNPTVRSSLRAAAQRLPQLLAWALLSTIVAVLLRALRGRRSGAGWLTVTLADFLGGIGWSLATFFVVPIVVSEGAWPFPALRRSAGLLRETWGQQLTGGFAFGLLDFAVWVAGGTLAFLFFQVHPFLGLWVGLPALVLLRAAVGALEGVFKAALYDFANGAIPDGFNVAALEGAYREA